VLLWECRVQVLAEQSYSVGPIFGLPLILCERCLCNQALKHWLLLFSDSALQRRQLLYQKNEANIAGMKLL
jgi:hypothetical protein